MPRNNRPPTRQTQTPRQQRIPSNDSEKGGIDLSLSAERTIGSLGGVRLDGRVSAGLDGILGNNKLGGTYDPINRTAGFGIGVGSTRLKAGGEIGGEVTLKENGGIESIGGNISGNIAGFGGGLSASSDGSGAISGEAFGGKIEIARDKEGNVSMSVCYGIGIFEACSTISRDKGDPQNTGSIGTEISARRPSGNRPQPPNRPQRPTTPNTPKPPQRKKPQPSSENKPKPKSKPRPPKAPPAKPITPRKPLLTPKDSTKKPVIDIRKKPPRGIQKKPVIDIRKKPAIDIRKKPRLPQRPTAKPKKPFDPKGIVSTKPPATPKPPKQPTTKQPTTPKQPTTKRPTATPRQPTAKQPRPNPWPRQPTTPTVPSVPPKPYPPTVPSVPTINDPWPQRPIQRPPKLPNTSTGYCRYLYTRTQVVWWIAGEPPNYVFGEYYVTIAGLGRRGIHWNNAEASFNYSLDSIPSNPKILVFEYYGTSDQFSNFITINSAPRIDNWDGKGWTWDNGISFIIIDIISDSCTPTPPPSSSPTQPPPPPKYNPPRLPNPPTKIKPMDCCKEIKEIYKYLGIAKIKKNKFKVAKAFMVPGGTGNEECEDFYAITQALFRMLANGLIINPVSNPLGNEWKSVNATAWAGNVYEMVAEAMGDGNTTQKYEIGMMMQTTQILSILAEQTRKIEFMSEVLGVEPGLETEELRACFTVYEGHKGFEKKEPQKIDISKAKTDNDVEVILGKMLQPSKIPIVKWVFKPESKSIIQVLMD